jgi:phosphatidate cytidylyltransferase
MNTVLLPIILGLSLFKVYRDGLQDLSYVFAVSACVLIFFTVLIRFVLRQKTAANVELMSRTITFWWMLAFFQVSVASNDIVFSTLLGVFSILAFYEYMRFAPAAQSKGNALLNLICGALIPTAFVLIYLGKAQLAVFLCFMFLVLGLPSLLVIENAEEGQLKRLGHLSSGIIFFALALPLAVAVYQFSAMVLLICVFLTEIRDMTSYWLGKFVQKRFANKPESTILRLLNYPIAVRINTSKSWGVGVLSMILMAGIALSFSGLLNRSMEQDISPLFIASWGVAIGFLGLMGDLTFSMLKRDFKIKDSGSLLPGKTGIIDRIDGLILTIPATYLLFIHLT